MKFKSQRSGPIFFCCASLLLALHLLQPQQVKAQWTTPDASQNINNTNSGNVGVGTTTPNYKLDVSNSVDKAQFRFGLGAGDSGGFLFSGAPSQATFAGGAGWNSGWVAKSLSASLIEANLGQLVFYANGGLSTGSPFTPAERMRITSGGNVGIGTNSPFANLHVATESISAPRGIINAQHSTDPSGAQFYFRKSRGTTMSPSAAANGDNLASLYTEGYDGSGYVSGGRLRFTIDGTVSAGNVPTSLQFLSGSSAGGVERMRITSAGNIGIGTTTPAYALDVQAGAQWAARFKKTDAAHGGILIDTITGTNPNLALSVNGAVKWYMNNNTANSDTLQFWESTGSTARFTLTQAGSVGIGTTAPGFRLDVQGGQLNSSGGLCIAGDCKTAWSQVGGSQWTTSGANVYYNTGNVGVGTTGPAELLHVSKNQNLGTSILVENQTAGTGAQARIQAKNNLGNLAQLAIYSSTTTPYGAISANNAYFYTQSPGLVLMADTATGVIKFSAGGSAERARIDAAGHLGIGTLTPNKSGVTKALTVNGTSDAIYELAVGDVRKGTMYHDNTNMSFTNNANGALTLGTNNAERLRVDSSGNVGIGTTSPTEKLEIAGNLKLTGTGNITATGNVTVSGTINAKYQDMAEWVESSQALSAGTVVVLDRTRSNQVVASSESYDTRVAGVISAQPGITLGEQSDSKVLVATTGRVKVKVDASAGPIQIGDLLVTSDIAGVAMKSEPLIVGGRRLHAPGTLIGKALEPLAKGTGEILVLLSLQ
jgi:hypothetical protein